MPDNQQSKSNQVATRMTRSAFHARLATVCILVGAGLLFEPGRNWHWAVALGFQVGAAFLLGVTLGRRWQEQGK